MRFAFSALACAFLLSACASAPAPNLSGPKIALDQLPAMPKSVLDCMVAVAKSFPEVRSATLALVDHTTQELRQRTDSSRLDVTGSLTLDVKSDSGSYGAVVYALAINAEDVAHTGDADMRAPKTIAKIGARWDVECRAYSLVNAG